MSSRAVTRGWRSDWVCGQFVGAMAPSVGTKHQSNQRNVGSVGWLTAIGYPEMLAGDKGQAHDVHVRSV